MRIHSNTLRYNDFTEAAKVAGADLDIFDRTMSRSHKHGYTVKLTGDAPNRPNGWDGYDDVRAASWDQWGVFFSVLFDADPEMVVGSVGRPTYDGVADFDRQTHGRFATLSMNGVRVGHGDKGHVYTPVDMHNRHTFDYVGEPATGGTIYRCRKCTAAKVVTR